MAFSMGYLKKFYSSYSPDFCDDLVSICTAYFRTGALPDFKVNQSSSGFSSSIDFLGTVDNVRRVGHKIFFIRVAGAPLVFKFFADFGGQSFGRRLEFFLQNLFRDPAYKSYKNAARLNEVGISTLCPVAYIASSSGLSRKSCFVYHMIESNHTAFDFLESETEFSSKVQLIKKIANLVLQMEKYDFYQPDFTLGNVLLLESSVGDVEPVLIDTDDIFCLKIKRLPKFLRYRLFFFFLKRLRPEWNLSRVFVETCLGQFYKEKWLKIWFFYRAGGFNLIKRLKRLIN